jgi:multisubunit Na+/H+ antiporter MnhB subunit
VLFGGVIEAFGTISLLMLWINCKRIKRLSARRVTKWALALAALCFTFIALYIKLFSYCVIAHQRGTAYYPLWTSGKIADMVSRAGTYRI